MSESLGGLQEALGSDVVEVHDAREIEGCTVTVTLRPSDGDELARALAALTSHELPALVRGGGTRMTFGNAPRDARVVLSTERLLGVSEFDEEDGVVHVAAGTPLDDVAEQVRSSGWELPLDPPGATTTIGGAIATAATGPRRQRFGAPRDSILGLHVVLPSGERTKCGGRVVKNVTGYDMAKLYAGSLGSLGVIESAWLRLRPLPPDIRTAVAVVRDDAERAFGLALSAARRDSAGAVALVTGEPAVQLGAPVAGDASWVLVVEFAGEGPSVARDIAWLEENAGTRTVPEASRLVGRLRDLQSSGTTRARIAVLPSRLEKLCEPITAAGLGVIVYPGPGIVYAIDAHSDPSAAVRAIDEAVAATDADLVFEELPLSLRQTRDVFGEAAGTLAIARALKQRFDPAGILNPGRFQGRL